MTEKQTPQTFLHLECMVKTPIPCTSPDFGDWMPLRRKASFSHHQKKLPTTQHDPKILDRFPPLSLARVLQTSHFQWIFPSQYLTTRIQTQEGIQIQTQRQIPPACFKWTFPSQSLWLLFCCHQFPITTLSTPLFTGHVKHERKNHNSEKIPICPWLIDNRTPSWILLWLWFMKYVKH